MDQDEAKRHLMQTAYNLFGPGVIFFPPTLEEVLADFMDRMAAAAERGGEAA